MVSIRRRDVFMMAVGAIAASRFHALTSQRMGDAWTNAVGTPVASDETSRRATSDSETAAALPNLGDIKPERVCSVSEGERQNERHCTYFGGRHNLKGAFTLIRRHLPQASLFIDIGANKGLVSSRWLELWRPELDINPKKYATTVVDAYFKLRNVTRQQSGHACGVTNMCDAPNPTEQAELAQMAPIPPLARPLVIHSFEPSSHLFLMHQWFLNNTESPTVRSHWKWHRIATSDVDTQLYFEQLWHEGSKINTATSKEPNTRAARLDTLAYHDKLFGENVMIDVLKIDAETVDAHVLTGASRLLEEQRIRLVMWETPNSFPINFTQAMGGIVKSFPQLIDTLDRYAGMTCYFPGTGGRAMKMTGCMEAFKKAPRCSGGNCPYENCGPDHSNAMCVHRVLAKPLYEAMEVGALTNEE